MAKRKDKSKKSRGGWGWLSSLVLSPFRYWRLTLFIAVIVLLYWQRNNILSWVISVINNTLWLFGWGLLFVAVAIGTIIVVIWKGKLSFVIHYWNQFLGIIVFILAIWGLLVFFPGSGVLEAVGSGGSIGLEIVGYPNFIGILRIAGLVLLSVILVAPKASFQAITKIFARFFSWLKLRFQKKPAAKLARPRKQVVPQIPVASELPEAEPENKAEAKAALTRAQTPQELKQVAQDVWKKYGESTDVVVVDGWRLPPLDILERSPEVQFSQTDNVQRAKLIEEALASYGVETKVVQINAGPTVTQFGVEPGWDRKMKEIREKDKDGSVKVKLEEVSKTRVKVERISSLANDLALALAAPTIRIEAPVPGKAIVGVEVPNTISTMVSLRGVIETSVFQKIQSKSKLSIALGKGAGGEAVAADMAKMPHLLIAGATGSGKTVCLNTIICCLLLYNTPYDVKFVMIDPKRVELTSFNSIPHLAAPVIVEPDKALSALRWLSQEMDKRYQKLASVSVRNIEGYNKNRKSDQKMPYLVLIIDELADLMMTGSDEVERILCRLAQLSRAVGIHLVVATQRPSVDVVTGLIKANFPTRISFAVTSQVDSRTILDGAGAEKLLGKGDMLYMPTEAGKPKRLQGCFVSDPEIERLVYFWGGQHRGEITSLNLEGLAAYQASSSRTDLPEDALLETARQLAKEHPHISTSFLQRKLRIGYPRAARLMEQLEEEGFKREEETEKEQS